MSLVSQRDVVFTPFMLRVQATLDGEDTWVPLRVRPSAIRRVAEAAHEWVSLRARSEQVIAEANAMLAGRAPLVDLEDESGTGELAFVIRLGECWARLAMGRRDRRGWVELRRDGQSRGEPVEPVDPSVLEDLIIGMLGGGRNEHG